jgi:hypothetical protein
MPLPPGVLLADAVGEGEGVGLPLPGVGVAVGTGVAVATGVEVATGVAVAAIGVGVTLPVGVNVTGLEHPAMPASGKAAPRIMRLRTRIDWLLQNSVPTHGSDYGTRAVWGITPIFCVRTPAFDGPTTRCTAPGWMKWPSRRVTTAST